MTGASMTLVGLLPPLCDNGNVLIDGGYGKLTMIPTWTEFTHAYPFRSGQSSGMRYSHPRILVTDCYCSGLDHGLYGSERRVCRGCWRGKLRISKLDPNINTSSWT